MKNFKLNSEEEQSFESIEVMCDGSRLYEFPMEKRELPGESRDNMKTCKELKIIMTLHPMHCGGACMLKLHMKDGRVSKITSAGDIPREGAYEKDESLMPIQRRACLLGISEKKRIYAPDRLKDPLKQTLERGNIRGFKRISWDEALDTVAGWYGEMLHRKDELGYLPVWDEGGVAPYLGPYLSKFGNPSSGNLQAATFASIGEYSKLKGNPPMDIFNSKYIVVWGNDTQATVPYLAFTLMKAKEAGIPVTVVDTRYTDTAATMGTEGSNALRYISVRPGTDAAMLAAMANVIYRRDLHDREFLKEYCFGFYPGDSVISQSSSKHPVTGEPYSGMRFTVPKGQSFVEYLDELQDEHGGYEGVLSWASKLTGTPRDVIEEFAIQYATAKPAFICSKLTGPQRTHNGMYFSWMLIALSAMTGNTTKRGGGFGEIRADDGYSIKLGPEPVLTTLEENKPILFSVFKLSDVMLHGLDGRTSKELREDVLAMNKIDLGQDARLVMEMYVRGAVGGNTFNQYQNINKRTIAWNKLKHVVSYERFMTSTAAWSDIILPTVTNFEESYFRTQWVADTFVVNGPIENMYEAKPDRFINEQIAKRLGIDYGRKGRTDREIMEEQWKKAAIPEGYKEINPEAKLPSFDEILEKANLQLPVPKEKTVIQTASIKPGEFDTDTGRINFYSPYYADRGRAALKVSKAQYVRPQEGYEEILEGGGRIGAKGIKYTLQFITPHLAQRALSTYGNVPVIAEQRPHVVEMHPEDAIKRDINDGNTVYVFNDYGCIKLPVMLTRRILPGVVSIGQGVCYRPSTTETYEAWFDADNDEKPEKYVVPVDVGGCTNSITGDLNSGVIDPFFCGLGLNAGGALCEISLEKPL